MAKGKQQQPPQQQSAKTKGSASDADTEVLDNLAKENKASIPNSQKITTYILAGAVAFIPLYLYTTPLIDMDIKQRLPVHVIAWIASAVILAHGYNFLASKHYGRLVASRSLDYRAVNKENKATQEEKLQSLTTKEASMYSVFALNVIYLSFALFFGFYSLPSSGLSPMIVITISNVVSAALSTGIAHSGLLA